MLRNGLHSIPILGFILLNPVFASKIREVPYQSCSMTEPNGPRSQDPALLEKLARAEACFLPDTILECNSQYSDVYSADGTCNNLKYPFYGRSRLPFAKFLPSDFADGKYKMRTETAEGNPLPLPRTIRTTLLPYNEKILSSNVNIFFAAFAQFLVDDVGFQIPIEDPGIVCCSPHKNGNVTQEQYDMVCNSLIIPEDDYFFIEQNASCLEFSRPNNTVYLNCDCDSEFFSINHQTPYFDASFIYGWNEEMENRVRTPDGYFKMLEEDEANGQLYPGTTTKNCPFGGITERERGSRCFGLADWRLNQNPELFAVGTSLIRLHNLIVKLLDSNYSTDGIELFYTAKKIVVAILQNITIKEFIPILLGNRITEIYGLNFPREGYAEGYDQSLNPQVTDFFSAAAGRTLHSIAVGTVDNGSSRLYNLKDAVFNFQFLFKKDAFLRMIEAFTTNTCQEQDRYFTEVLTDLFFVPQTASKTVDLIAVDIARSRDYGIRPYNEMREACGLCPFETFEEFAEHIREPEIIEKLKMLYKSMDEVEFYPAALLEKPVDGGILGPSAACGMGQAFYTMFYSDRLFYQFESAQFTPAQLETIQSITSAQMLCTTNPDLESIPKNAFLVSCDSNPVIPCETIRRIDLTAWQRKNN